MLIPEMKKTYNGQEVLNFEGLEIDDGSIVALMGENGSGKSTLAKILTGIIPSDNGKIKMNQSIGYLAQDPYIFNLSVRNNILQNAEGLSKEAAHEKCNYLMEKLGILDIADKKAKKISGGEKAKLALCRILMKHYDILILDEPTSGMDDLSIPLAADLIKQVAKEEGMAVIVIIHGTETAKLIAKKAIVLTHSGSLKEFSNI